MSDTDAPKVKKRIPDFNGPQDPVDTFKEALAEEKKWARLFRDGGLTQTERDGILRAMAGARGLESYRNAKDKRALELLLAGDREWYEGLLRAPKNIPSALSEALAAVASRD